MNIKFNIMNSQEITQSEIFLPDEIFINIFRYIDFTSKDGSNLSLSSKDIYLLVQQGSFFKYAISQINSNYKNLTKIVQSWSTLKEKEVHKLNNFSIEKLLDISPLLKTFNNINKSLRKQLIHDAVWFPEQEDLSSTSIKEELAESQEIKILSYKVLSLKNNENIDILFKNEFLDTVLFNTYVSTIANTHKRLISRIVTENFSNSNPWSWLPNNSEAWSNKIFVYIRIKLDSAYLLEKAHDDLKKDKVLVFAVVKQTGIAIKYAHIDLKKDREIVLAAVKQNGIAIEYAHIDLKKDREIVLAAVKQNGKALEYAHDDLKKDKEILLAAVEQDGCALKYAQNELNKDRVIVLAAVKQNGWALYYAHKDLKNDKEIVLAAVKKYGLSLEFAHKDLKNDKEIVLKAVKQNGLALGFANLDPAKDREIILEAVKQNGLSLQYADDKLRKDEEILIAAVSQNIKALEYAYLNQDNCEEIFKIENAEREYEKICEEVRKEWDRKAERLWEERNERLMEERKKHFREKKWNKNIELSKF